jgi:hypothetical protein
LICDEFVASFLKKEIGISFTSSSMGLVDLDIVLICSNDNLVATFEHIDAIQIPAIP